MKISLKAKFELSKSLPGEARTELKKFFDDANKGLLLKGAKDKKEGSRVTDIQFKGKNLILNISSGGQVRAHSAISRLRKQLAEFLGRKFKVGTRSVTAEDYKIEFELENKPKSNKINIPFASKINISGNKCKFEIKKIDEDFLQNGCIERMIKLVEEKIKLQYYEGKDEYKENRWESKQKKMHYNKDPVIELEKRKWIVRAPGKGQWVFGREYTLLSNIFKELMIKHIYEDLNFHEMIFPKFEPWDIPRISGHASSIYPLAYFVYLPEDASQETWEKAMDYYSITKKIDFEEINKHVYPAGISSYAQCPPFWPYLQNRTIDESSLPLRIYDWSGPTYRNESGGTHGLDRIEEFHRTETLFVGTKKQVIDTWKKLNTSLINFFDKILDIEFKVDKVSPWWMAHEGKTTEKGSEEVGTFDFDAYLPYRGDRDSEWLEIQNNSSIGPKYPSAFRVKGRKEEIWSGCAGGSMERWIVTFLAQKGLDTKYWPKEIRVPFEKDLKKIKTLKFVS